MERTERIRGWFNSKAGRFLLTQLVHTAITVLVVAAIFFGAARAGALSGVLTPAAQAPQSSFTTVNYQGRLADPAGNPIDNPNPGLGMTFALYDVQTGGAALWSETHANVPVSNGLFSVRLGSINALDTDLLAGDRWLGIQVGADPEMAPRENLAAVPYAMVAREAQSLAGGTLMVRLPQQTYQVTSTGDQPVPVPDSTINLTLAAPSTVLLWAMGNVGYGTDTSNNTMILVDGTQAAAVEQRYGMGSFSLITSVQLASGPHTIQLAYWSEQAGTIAAYWGDGYGFASRIGYLVIGQP